MALFPNQMSRLPYPGEELYQSSVMGDLYDPAGVELAGMAPQSLMATPQMMVDPRGIGAGLSEGVQYGQGSIMGELGVPQPAIGQLGTPEGIDAYNMRTNMMGRANNLRFGLDALNTAAGAFSAFTGYKQMKTAQDALRFQKEAYRTNLANQTKLTNQEMERRATYAQKHAGTYSPSAVEEYMNKNRL